MAIDTALVLDEGRTVSGDENTTALDVEGGFHADALIQLGAMTGGTSLDVRIQYSPDGGSNYYMCPGGKFQQLDGNDDSLKLRIPVFIPEPTTQGNMVKVRVSYDDTGNGTWVVSKVWLEPMTSLSQPAGEKAQANGYYSATNAN